MTSHSISGIKIGTCHEALTPSESYPAPCFKKEDLTSSSVTLWTCPADSGRSNPSSDSDSESDKIVGHGPPTSQDDDYADQVALRRPDALLSISAEGSLDPSHENLALRMHKIISESSLLQYGEAQVYRKTSCVESPPATLENKRSSSPLESGHLTRQPFQMDPERSQPPCSGVVWTASSIINISALVLNSSFVLQEHPGFSHRVDFESCEGLPSLLRESFKSTAGHSDDILPRTIFNGVTENKERDAKVDFSISLENRPDTSSSSAIRGLAISGPDTTNIDTTLRSTKQAGQSHEEMGMGCAPHHSDIPSSSPLEHIECAQSNPYFTPATIVRAHSPDFRTDVVGIQELVSSSPPPSPSMTSNYLQSSSPISSSNPMDRSIQTPPTSSPTVPEEYSQTLSEGVEEDFYTEQTYTAYSHYPLDHGPYRNMNPHISNDFFPLPAPQQHINPQHHMSSISGALVPPTFVQDFLDATAEPPKHVEQYPPPELNLTASEVDLPVPGPSNPPIRPPPPVIEAKSSSAQNRQVVPKNVVPNPKRPTLAGVKQQQKKLSRPFRSPVIHAPVRLAPKPPTPSSGPLISSANSAILKDAAAETAKVPNAAAASSSSQPADTKIKHRTARASSQFKSPLASSSTTADEAALVRLTPTIQSLERKLQLLRRALKVREDVQEEVLEGLVNKWSEAGKEVAWEVWDAVKDNANAAEDDKKGKKRAVEESWGWDEGREAKKTKGEEEKDRNWGWDVVPVGEEERQASESAESPREEEGRQPTLGTMLLQLGIAPETFGWSEEEGAFVDKEA